MRLLLHLRLRRAAYALSCFLFCGIFAKQELGAECRIALRSSKHLRLNQSAWLFSNQVSSVEANNKYSNNAKWQEADLDEDWLSLGLDSAFDGMAWYRCILDLEILPEHQYAFYLGQSILPARVFINGALIGETKNFGTRQYNLAREYIFSIDQKLWEKGENLITIALRGRASIAKGISDKAALTDEHKMTQALILKDMPQIFFSFAYILLAVLIGLFYFAPQQKAALFLGLLSFALGYCYLLRTWVQYEIFHSPSSAYITQLFFLFLCPPLMLEYMIRVTKGRLLSYRYIFYIPSCVLIVTLLLGANDPYLWNILEKSNLLIITLSIAYVVYLLRQYKSRQEEGEKSLSCLSKATYVLVPVISWDILAAMGLHGLVRLSPYGFFFFIACAFLEIMRNIVTLYQHMLADGKHSLLIEKNKTRSVYNMSREFETNLKTLQLLCKNARKTKEQQKDGKTSHAGHRQEAQRAVLRLENLLYDNEQFKQLEAGSYIPKHNSIDIKELCRKTVEKLAAVYSKQKAKRIKLTIQKNIGIISNDPELIALALYHLLENALVYTTGKIECGISREEKNLCLEITDEGPGIKNEDRVKVFQKFFRAGEPQQETEGIGIGLSLVSLIAQKLQGAIDFHNNHGFFSSFRLTLPGD